MQDFYTHTSLSFLYKCGIYLETLEFFAGSVLQQSTHYTLFFPSSSIARIARCEEKSF